jgi:hypothetical protein
MAELARRSYRGERKVDPMPIRVRITERVKGKRVRSWREATDDSPQAEQIAIWGSMEAREAGMRKIAKTLSKARGYRVTVEDAERLLHPPPKKG